MPQIHRILVISESLHTLPEAVRVLDGSGHQVTYVEGLIEWPKLPAQAASALQDADAVVMGRVMGVDASALELAPALRVIALHTSGSDNVDVAAATQRGVLVTNVKGVNAEQCAEFAMGLTLSVVRQICTGDQAIRAGLWATRTHTSMDLHGSTVGVIGLGLIAKAFVRRVLAFGVRVLVYTRTPDAAAAQELGIEYAAFDEVLRTSDVLCLFASLNEETRGMIGAKELAAMKRSAYLVNIARGELVQEDALYQALRSGQIAGAGLDVFETEPLYESPLFALPNVVLTPHQAGLTQGGKAGAAIRAARNALEVLNGTVPLDAINRRAHDVWMERGLRSPLHLRS
ncbi:MAG: hydroxyacid dehydrogenase [Rhodospirillales bacterium]|nr:hydroxyacid dehydrogenase [Acetobacter sp.]